MPKESADAIEKTIARIKEISAELEKAGFDLTVRTEESKATPTAESTPAAAPEAEVSGSAKAVQSRVRNKSQEEKGRGAEIAQIKQELKGELPD